VNSEQQMPQPSRPFVPIIFSFEYDYLVIRISKGSPILFLILCFCVIGAGQDTGLRCPKVEVEGPEGVIRPGEPFSFRAIVTNGSAKLSYRWLLSTGRILEGQGTLQIRVVYSNDQGRTPTATIEVDGLAANCTNHASATLAPYDPPNSIPLDEYGPTSWSRESNRVHQWKTQLAGYRDAQVYIYIYGPTKKVAQANRRIRRIKESFGASQNQLTFLTVTSKQETTKVYLVPPGAIAPRP